MASKHNWVAVRLARVLCRRLPPFLAYRMKHAWADRVIPRSGQWSSRCLFGGGVSVADLSDTVEREFALMGTANFGGMALASCVVGADDTVFELGANVGTETVSIAMLAGRVVAVEAQSDNASRLRTRLAQAHVANVTVEEKAVCDCAGDLRMTLGPVGNRGLSFLVRTTPGANQEDRSTVAAITLDELGEIYGPARLVLMDVEGAEYSALTSGKGVLSRARPLMLMEVDSHHLWRMAATPAMVLDLLLQHEYCVYDMNQRSLPMVERNGLQTGIHTDWLAIPLESKAGMLPLIKRTSLRARVMPRILGMNPL